MKEEHLVDVSSFLAELSHETDRGLPLVASALLDELLARTLGSFFDEGKHSERLLHGATSPLGTFSARIDACRALGLIDDYEFREISLIRKVRNEFAHSKHGLTFNNSKIRGLCTSLESDLPSGPGLEGHSSRFRFQNAVACMALRLYYRPDWVERERRMVKEWVPKDMSRWRSIDTEKPPEGVPVLGFGRPGGPHGRPDDGGDAT
jgi:mannitol operon repressor